VDADANAIDDEYSYVISDFQPTRPTTGATSTATPTTGPDRSTDVTVEVVADRPQGGSWQFTARATATRGALVSWHIDYGDGDEERSAPRPCSTDAPLEQAISFAHDYAEPPTAVVTVTATTATSCSPTAPRADSRGTVELAIPF